MKIAKTLLTFGALAAQFSATGTQSLIFESASNNTLEQSVSQPRLRQHETNQFLLDYTGGGSFDGHIDVQLSVAYLLTDPDWSEYFEKNDADWNLALAGTIEFDFYVGTRDSSPVVGRRYNPSLQYYYSRNESKGWQEWRLSIEHESNGQATEDIDTLNQLARSFRLQYQDRHNFTDQKAFELAEETISLSNNFFSVGGVYRFSPTNINDRCNSTLSCFDIHLKLRQQIFGDGQNGEFRSPVNQEDRLKDYQGTRIGLINRWNEKNSIGLILRTGQLAGGDPFKNNTLEINYHHTWHIGQLEVPLSLSYRNGYLEELYNYSNRSSSLQFGFNFLY